MTKFMIASGYIFWAVMGITGVCSILSVLFDAHPKYKPNPYK